LSRSRNLLRRKVSNGGLYIYMDKITNSKTVAAALDWGEVILALVRNHPVIAPLILIAIEEFAIPLPLPGEVLIVYTGYQASRGISNYTFAFISFFFAVLIGASILYCLSVKWGNFLVLRLGKLFHLDQKKLHLIEERFRRHGMLFIILGRMIPGFRIPITIFAGMSKVPYKTFIYAISLSNIIWIPLYLYIGKVFGPQSHRILQSRYSILFIISIPVLVAIIYYFFYKSIDTKN